jgi:4-diphosphocytidyl-2-C-methyl-D-erythritol kinase
MTLVRPSPCKVNLLLNVLGKRPDGFHELETVLQPLAICDELHFEPTGGNLMVTCSEPTLPAGPDNLVHRAATAFFTASGIQGGVRIHLTKRIPLAAGLGGGSGNAANTLAGLNELFGLPLGQAKLGELAATLGSDVPFFLQDGPALATGRGEKIQPLPRFTALRGAAMLLIHPGFGIATPWAYQHLARFPQALNGQRGRAAELVDLLGTTDLAAAGRSFHNSLEAPVFHKYPILAVFQEFLREQGALAALMSGSGSTTFALAPGPAAAQSLREKFLLKFGAANWTAVVAL